ncbi:hypothetical protein [Sphingomonas profundi]|uniref:hypothetical protein n=1 Tax=Alterirhizorhabdus profundi TaxID=2681549 RepID=UPI0012E81582|nr:hypothetical protein [Sphingomonas profundi]
MMEGLEARGLRAGRARAEAALAAIASADLPPGVTAERDADGVIFSGPRLLRRRAFDARFAAPGLPARDA